jgi:hypothetical protein
VSLAVVAVVLAGAASVLVMGRASSSACGPAQAEPEDERSGLHVLPNAADPTYAADPPTSGPHVAGPGLRGVQAERLRTVLQVGVLEEGKVLVQYQPAAGDPSPLMELAGDQVVVAPNPDLNTPVVATAWGHRLTCTAVDPTAVAAFVAARAGQGGHRHG